MQESREKLLQSLSEKLMYTVKSMHNLIDFPLKKQDMKTAQMDILFKVAKSKEGISVKELATAMNLTSGAITQYTNELVEQHLIVREEDKVDRRLVRLHLSPDTKEIFEEHKKAYFKKLETLFSNLTDEDLEILLTLLRKI